MKEIIQTLLIAIVLRDPGGLPLPARLARYPDPHAGRASLVGGYICSLPAVRLLHQYAFDVRVGAGHRLVVDDAIVVVEGVQRHIGEGWRPRTRPRRAMEELSGPVIAIALVLSSVFVPTAFIPGITGRLYQQLPSPIAISVVLSAFNALTLSPALAGLLLRPKGESHGPLSRFFDRFNRMFERGTEIYVQLCGGVIRKGVLALVVIAAFGIGAGSLAAGCHPSFLPMKTRLYLHQHATSECGFAGTHERSGEAG